MKPYDNSQYNAVNIIDYYDELPLWSAPFGLKLLDTIEYKPGISVLDIGYGGGFPMIEVAQRLGNGSTVYGIDPWSGAYTKASAKISYYGIENIRLIEGYAEDIPLNNASLDLIISNNGINNVKDCNKVLSECSRLLKRNGQFVMTMNVDKSMFEFYRVLENVLNEMGLFANIKLMHQHIHNKRMPLDEIINIIENNGFIIRKADHDQFNYKFADGTAMLNHYFIRIAFMSAWMGFLPAGMTETIFQKVESELNIKAGILGGLILSIPYVTIDAIKKG